MAEDFGSFSGCIYSATDSASLKLTLPGTLPHIPHRLCSDTDCITQTAQNSQTLRQILTPQRDSTPLDIFVIIVNLVKQLVLHRWFTRVRASPCFTTAAPPGTLHLFSVLSVASRVLLSITFCLNCEFKKTVCAPPLVYKSE